MTKELTPEQTAALAVVERSRAALADLAEQTAAMTDAMHEAIRAAVDTGVSSARVAGVAGVSKGRVSQIAPRAKAVPPRVQAQKEAPVPSCVTPFATVPGLPGPEVATLSGLASTRHRMPYGRVTVCRPTAPVADLLAGVTGTEAGRIIVTGPAPTGEQATMAEQVRAWALGPVPEGWAAESHHLAQSDLPVLRFRHTSGQRVVIVRGASWWGETDASPEVCADAWTGLGRALDAVKPFAGIGLADTPATTGRALWRATIPEGKSYPVLSDEYRELLAATSGQGRIERMPEPAWLDSEPRARRSTCESFTYLDGRMMYAALTWGMPVGEPRRWTGAQVDALDAREAMATLRGRGRWHVMAVVPQGWEHVGLLGVPEAGSGRWLYPNRPGEVFHTWADGSEVWLAMERGWDVTIHEGITWAEGKPLDVWRNSLVSVWETCKAHPSEAAQLAAKAVRSILITTLGAFASRTHPVTHTAPIDGPAPEIPAGTEVRQVGANLVWQTPGTLSAWSAQTAHPEWSATVWARARTRLLSARGVGQERVGVLSLPPSQVVAMSTDALYLAGNPGWADDGAVGRFRSKGTRPGPFTWPSTAADLYRLRDEAEAAGA